MPDNGAPIPEGKHELVQRIQQETDSNKMIHLVQQLIDQLDSERVVKAPHQVELPNDSRRGEFPSE